MRHHLALQQRLRRDHEYSSPTIDELHAVMANGLPETIDDMRAWFEDRIETLQERIRGGNTDVWEAYWEAGGPREEDFCRDRMIEHLSIELPTSIRLEPETHMVGDNRADYALTRNAVKLPVEIKGQWNRSVWDAIIHQLDAKYTVDWQAEGRGAYVVLWFGDVAGKQLPSHPDGADRPTTPEELRKMLIERICRKIGGTTSMCS